MKRTAFTLMELLIVVCILIILSTGVVILINPISIINKGTDTARKKDLDDAKKMLEQYMNDTGCYPKPTQVCIDGNNTSGTCHICTKEQSPSFSYFTKDICDPRHGIADYLYQTETIPGYKPPGGVWIPPAVSACPKWFRIYSVLDSVYSAAEDIWGCKKGGCGVSPYYGYSYLVTSPGAPSETIFAGDWGCYLGRLQ